MTDPIAQAANRRRLDAVIARLFRLAVDAERDRRLRPRNDEIRVRARTFAECYADAVGTRLRDAEHEIAAVAAHEMDEES